MSNIKITMLFLLGLIAISCEAPRDNPLDPDSDAFWVIEGSVQTFSLPYTPLPGVSVYWAPSRAMVKTDNQGKFRIGNAYPASDFLIFQKEGYRTDSLLVNWGDLNRINIQVNLNKLPVLDSSSIYTSVVNLSDENRSFELTIKLKITDDDKDIDSVFVLNDKLSIRRSLSYDIISKFYQATLTSDEVSMNDVEDVIGEDFIFFVSDIFGDVHNVGRGYVSRIIRSGATADTPDNNSSVDSLPTLLWKKFEPGYSLSYNIEVYKSDPLNPQLVHRSTGIQMDSTSLRLRSPLQPSSYFWVIWTIDSFRNSSRSKPATFQVR
jgi:hypothetical protein